jgi:hypothetical protein
MRQLSTPRLVWIERPQSLAGIRSMWAAATGMFVRAGRANRRWQLFGFWREGFANWLDPVLKITQGEAKEALENVVLKLGVLGLWHSPAGRVTSG